ncbi:Hypothetical protein HVR_LOCUS1219 [uncultured virus]|nr:Hypothetical protein HVR_LOCUS1219 [uncultured virus]
MDIIGKTDKIKNSRETHIDLHARSPHGNPIFDGGGMYPEFEFYNGIGSSDQHDIHFHRLNSGVNKSLIPSDLLTLPTRSTNIPTVNQHNNLQQHNKNHRITNPYESDQSVRINSGSTHGINQTLRDSYSNIQNLPQHHRLQPRDDPPPPRIKFPIYGKQRHYQDSSVVRITERGAIPTTRSKQSFDTTADVPHLTTRSQLRSNPTPNVKSDYNMESVDSDRVSTTQTRRKSSGLLPFNNSQWHLDQESDQTKVGSKSIYTPSNFWFEDPSTLFQSFDIIPNSDMTDAERLNAMTRIIIIIAAIMFAVKFPAWWIFLILALLVVIILWYIIKGREESYSEQIRRQTEYLRRPKKSIIVPIPNNNNNNVALPLHTIHTQPLNLISNPR